MPTIARLIALLLAGLLLAACAAAPPRAPSEAPVPVQSTPSKPAPPPAALTSQLLYDLLLGEIAGQRGRLEVAVASLKRAALASRDPRLAQRATQVALYAKRPDEAIDSARLWVELQPDDLEAREALSVALLEHGQLVEAQAQMEQILALTAGGDNLGQAYLRLAALLGKQTLRAAALDVMRALVALHPQLQEAQFALAHIAVRAGELDTAAAAIDQALRLAPSWEDAALFKIRILGSQKETAQAEAFYEKFLGEYPQAKTLRMNYARHLVDTKQWERAREQFKRVVADNPRDADAVYAVGLLALQSEVYDEAEKYLRQNLELQPENDQARLYLGHLAERRKQYDEARRRYDQIDSGGFFFEAQVRIGLLIARQGDLAGARAHLAGLDPESENQHIQLILAEDQMLRDAKQYNEAFAVLTKGLRRFPDNTDLLYGRALVAERLDRIDAHEADLRKILKTDPKNANALNALGYTLADRTTRYREAFELIEQALAIKPDDPYIMDSMGWVQYRLGNLAEARKYLKSALDKRDDAEIAAHLGEVLWMLGDKAGAESVWKRALQDTPDNESLQGVIKKFKP
ncbi:MAG: tetratricopeptide repeat protein [Gammaproteobacteria bacterium]|nr:tetratricopeptide repeat protein [Gammaproteobacteria bacterium]